MTVADKQDKDLVDTALRESSEELAIVPGNVEILGALPTEYSLGNKARVWPIVVSTRLSGAYSGPDRQDLLELFWPDCASSMETATQRRKLTRRASSTHTTP